MDFTTLDYSVVFAPVSVHLHILMLAIRLVFLGSLLSLLNNVGLSKEQLFTVMAAHACQHLENFLVG
jgi:hypothetical protein